MDYSYINQRITVSGKLRQSDMSEIARIGFTGAILIGSDDYQDLGLVAESLRGHGLAVMAIEKQEEEDWDRDSLSEIANAGMVEIARGGRVLISSPRGYRRAVFAAISIMIRLGANTREAESMVRAARRGKAYLSTEERDRLHAYHRTINGLPSQNPKENK